MPARTEPLQGIMFFHQRWRKRAEELICTFNFIPFLQCQFPGSTRSVIFYDNKSLARNASIQPFSNRGCTRDRFHRRYKWTFRRLWWDRKLSPCSNFPRVLSRRKLTGVWITGHIRRFRCCRTRRKRSIPPTFRMIMHVDFTVHCCIVFVDGSCFRSSNWRNTMRRRDKRGRRGVTVHWQLCFRQCTRKQRRCLRFGGGFPTTCAVCWLARKFNWRREQTISGLDNNKPNIKERKGIKDRGLKSSAEPC